MTKLCTRPLADGRDARVVVVAGVLAGHVGRRPIAVARLSVPRQRVRRHAGTSANRCWNAVSRRAVPVRSGECSNKGSAGCACRQWPQA
jgi:hypothetical protein